MTSLHDTSMLPTIPVGTGMDRFGLVPTIRFIGPGVLKNRAVGHARSHSRDPLKIKAVDWGGPAKYRTSGQGIRKHREGRDEPRRTVYSGKWKYRFAALAQVYSVRAVVTEPTSSRRTAAVEGGLR